MISYWKMILIFSAYSRRALVGNPKISVLFSPFWKWDKFFYRLSFPYALSYNCQIVLERRFFRVDCKTHHFFYDILSESDFIIDNRRPHNFDLGSIILLLPFLALFGLQRSNINKNNFSHDFFPFLLFCNPKRVY